MEKIHGFIEHIIYQNKENGYCVFQLSTREDEITCVGTLPYVGEGEWIEAEGAYTVHSSYGEQFKISSFEVKDPEDQISIERYLGSGAIKGVGTALAARIVRHFKEDTLRVIEEEPELTLNGINIRDYYKKHILRSCTEKDSREYREPTRRCFR